MLAGRERRINLDRLMLGARRGAGRLMGGAGRDCCKSLGVRPLVRDRQIARDKAARGARGFHEDGKSIGISKLRPAERIGDRRSA